MPSFDFLDTLELFLQTGKFPEHTPLRLKRAIRTARKRFIYKDGLLWRPYRGRLLRVVRSESEIKEILTRYHDNNNHAGRERVVREIMLMYYWVGVSNSVRDWVNACPSCHNRASTHTFEPAVAVCLVYGCDASSYAFPELTFHRFPKAPEQRRKWLEVAQRDQASLRTNSHICSRHFDPSCFTLSDDGQLTLSKDAVPTIMTLHIHEGSIETEDFVYSCTWEEKLSNAAAAADATAAGDTAANADAVAVAAALHADQACNRSDAAMQLQEHQYCLPGPAPDSRAARIVSEFKRRTDVEPAFITYNHIARYLSTRVLPMQGKSSKYALKRMAKRFSVIDGVLMYTRVTPPVRVPRSREEVNSILQQFHDNQGHYGQGICQRQIAKHFYWGTLGRDLASWISSCQTCVNRSKRKMIRCSVSKCTNRCGPVERKLGLVFHKFPLYNLTLLAQWLKACGRGSWHPRLWSSICSSHFTEDCYDRSGDKVTLRPDAVPTVNVHSDSVTQPSGALKTPAGEEAFFAKYDAVELYITKRIYPPGLTYVEKNTFRRFCKRYAIIDGKLHMLAGEQVRLVLRSRQEVDAALTDFHNELNHLNVNKCLRLLNERYYWQTMKPDVVQWISSCSQCSVKMKKKPNRKLLAETSEMLQTQRSSDCDSDSEKDHDSDGAYDDGVEDYTFEDDCNNDDDDDENGDDVVRGGIIEEPILESVETMCQEIPSVTAPKNPSAPIKTEPRIPILIHLKSPNQLQQQASVLLKPRIPTLPFVTKVWSSGSVTPAPRDLSKSSESPSNTAPLQSPESEKAIRRKRAKSGSKDTLKPHESAQAEGPNTSPPEPRLPSEQSNLPKKTSGAKSRNSKDVQSTLPSKRKKGLKDVGSAQGGSTGLEPVVAPSTKPWPVFTIADSSPAQAADQPPKEDSLHVFRKSKKLQARIIIQQCSEAKLKVKPAIDGADPEWVEIQQGMIVYVCFFHEATEQVMYEIANKLMYTRMFRRNMHSVSVLDLPGSVLLVPQESLVCQVQDNRRMQHKGGCELWRGAQLFSTLVRACRELMSESPKCTKEGMKVEHGVVGQKQEIVLMSPEPLSVLLEF